VCVRAHARARVCVCVREFLCVYVYVYVHLCVHIYMDTSTHLFTLVYQDVQITDAYLSFLELQRASDSFFDMVNTHMTDIRNLGTYSISSSQI